MVQFMKIVFIGIVVVTVSANEGESSYRDYIQGSLAANYVQPFNGDTYINTEKQDPDAVMTAEIDLYLLPMYYGGLYIGYKSTFSDTEGANALHLEKRYKNFSVYYSSISSQEYVTPLFDNDLRFIDRNSKVTMGAANRQEEIPYKSNRYELRYYGIFKTSLDQENKPFGYLSVYYESTKRLLIGRDTEGKLTKDFYTEGSVDIYALSFGISQRDYELPKGFFVTGAFDLGIATMDYTDSFSYGDNGVGESPVLAWGMNFEAGYNIFFTENARLLLAAYGGYTTAGDGMSSSAKEMYSQGNVGIRTAFSF